VEKCTAADVPICSYESILAISAEISRPERATSMMESSFSFRNLVFSQRGV